MPDLVLASRRRRLGSLLYEVIILAAVLLVAGFVLVPISQGFGPRYTKPVLQLGLWCVMGLYSVLCWCNGHTLPMKTWGIQVVRKDGHALRRVDALYRFLAATVSIGLFGLGYLWCMFDRERQFFHDRLAGTRLVDFKPSAPLKPTNNCDARDEK